MGVLVFRTSLRPIGVWCEGVLVFGTSLKSGGVLDKGISIFETSPSWSMGVLT